MNPKLGTEHPAMYECRSCDQNPIWVKTKDCVVMVTEAHPEVRAGKQSRSNVEQAVGQSKEVRVRELGEAEARECSILHRLKGKLPPESRWNSAGCLVQAPAGSGSHLLLMQILPTGFWYSRFSVFWMLSQSSLIKLFRQKLRKVTPFVENARSKLKDRFFFLKGLGR